MKRRIFIPLGLVVLAAFESACNKTKFVDNSLYRALDRPVDLAVICASAECNGGTCSVLTYPLANCTSTVSATSCKARDGVKAPPQLVGFVANSERSELAVFSDCEGKLVDLDVSNPGSSLLPVGHLPVSVSAAADGCRVVSANAGSCDISVVDAKSMATLALTSSTPVDGAGEPVDPAEMVAQLSPLRYDATTTQWSPLGVSPSQVIAAPSEVSQAVDGQDSNEQCSAQQPGSTYALFPGCDLVAEINLVSGKILQSVQFVKDVSGKIDLVSTGSSPVCPVLDCPSATSNTPVEPTLQLAGLRPRTFELVSRHTYQCDNPLLTDTETGQAQPCPSEYKELPAMSLLVAGVGADAIYEIQSDESSNTWSDSLVALDLPGSGGISRLRVSPPIPNPSPGCGGPSEAYTQFIYAIAGDGSTRVVARDFVNNDASLGQECDTQIDPSVTPSLVCVCEPAESTLTGDRPLRRRLLANGPGIRLPNSNASGAQPRATDWTFYRVNANDPPLAKTNHIFAPSFDKLLIGIGTTDNARVVMTPIGHFARPGDNDERGLAFSPRVSAWTVDRDRPDLVGLVDPMKTIALGLAPHNPLSDSAFSQLWPGEKSSPGKIGLPLVADEIPSRSFPGRRELHSDLAPGIRSIDAAYRATVEPIENAPLESRLKVGPANSSPTAWIDADKLGSGSTRLYQSPSARVISRDYLAWQRGSSWSLVWEGSIPGTGSARGRLACDNPAFGGSACLPKAAGESRLIDDAANFCTTGVLAGDKLAIAGCQIDDDCGEGQRCLKRSESAVEVSGICVSALAFETSAAQLRAQCEHFISDPCGEPVREFLITRAFEHELHLQVLDQPEASHLLTSAVDACAGGGRNNHPSDSGERCLCDEGYVPCDGSAQGDVAITEVLDCCRQADDGSLIEDVVAAEVIDRFVCLPEQPDGGCALDTDCGVVEENVFGQLGAGAQRYATRYCMEGRCRRPCLDSDDVASFSENDRNLLALTDAIIARDECSVRRLPGPACFQELVRYDVRARNAFVVRSDQESTRYFANKVTANAQGECIERPAADVSNLLTSRIPLGPDVEHLGLPACDAGDQIPGSTAPNPCVETVPRPAENPGRFHYFSYQTSRAPVASVRFSNPIFSFNLDLTDLFSLLSPIPGTNEGWPAEFASFRRARIPRGYATGFSAAGTGYSPLLTVPFIDDGVSNTSSLIFPTRIMASPVRRQFYVVDTGDRESALNVRGQVMRLYFDGYQLSADSDKFSGVR